MKRQHLTRLLLSNFILLTLSFGVEAQDKIEPQAQGSSPAKTNLKKQKHPTADKDMAMPLNTKKKEKKGNQQTRNQNLRIYYASSPWNQDSTQPDSAYLFFRDGHSGKLAKILIEETEPDSSTFEGNFSIGWVDIDSLEPEVYIPPEGMRENSDANMAKFYKLLSDKKVTSKPLVFRTSPEGQKILEVYDTQEQAVAAKAAFDREAELARQAEAAKNALSKPIPDEASVEAAKMAERQAALDLMAQEAAKREGDRIRLEQIERQRTEERIKQQALLTEKARLNRLAQAKEYSDAALDFYRLGQFKEAEEAFRQSVQLDPENKDYYFKYAITLYRNEKFNEALVVMKLADTNEGMNLEKEYYMGLIHFRLKELDSALSKFSVVQNANDPSMSPSAAFYRGVIFYNQEKFTEAKAPFEWVLDVSQDPALDNRAEEYLEKIAQMIAYNKNKAKKFLVNGSAGVMHDSNVLLAPDNVTSQGSATEEADTRYILGGDLEYRWIQGKTNDLSTKLSS
ncbi:MAG: tetratricopeptide repeat protein, partial [Bdellovibrionales bacterium]|nr:tetratricopeptide repeat protein [Bdellovibrionales bacterium]